MMMLHNPLPLALLWLLDVMLVSAQTRQLPLNIPFSSTSTNSQTFAIPAADSLMLSVATCSRISSLRFMVSNTSSSDSIEIALSRGHGKFISAFPDGGVLRVQGTGSFEVGLSDTGQPMHEEVAQLPLLGDTTSNQAILFSPSFGVLEQIIPRYPNYTMPPPDIPQSPPPKSPTNYTLSLFRTQRDDYPKTSCFLSSQAEAFSAEESFWLRDEEGWRTQYVVRGLTPSTNYTAYLLDSTAVVGPIYFTTKSAAFPCHLVSNLPFCPRVAYAMPLAAPPAGADIYTGDTLPTVLADPLRSYMTNFTVSLGRFACGRDLYSPLVGCTECQREYRKWLCAISLPRCSEASPNGAGTAVPAQPTATGISATKNSQQQVLSALVPIQTSDPPRNENLPQFNSAYEVLLPCIETCNAVDRACPPFLGFKCPTAQFNGHASYGIGYIDGVDEDEHQGLTGTSQDRYGNVWCAAG